jgi:oxygen-dependent protoporphyrinogen oxidase
MRVAVVGGGIAGLAAALDLADSDSSVTVLEGSGRFGGQIGTERRDGFIVESGAEGFTARSEAVPELCRRTGLGADLIVQARSRTLAWRDARLVELDDGAAAQLLGIPVREEDLGRGLRSLRGGMGDLIGALLGSLERRAVLNPNARVTALRREGAAWRLECAGGTSLEVDGVVLAVPPGEAESLLAPLAGNARLAGQIRFGSTVTVTLAYAREAVTHALDANGFVVDGPGPDGLRACTFSSSKFPDRAPAGWCLLRAFITPEPGPIDPDADRWCERAHRLLAPILGLTDRPRARWVSGWSAALPRYAPDHAAAVAIWRRQLSRHGRLECAGAALDGGGIDGAVRSGRLAARRVAAPRYESGRRAVEVTEGA